jgi:20S proteasome alpha/beta subunit
MLKNLMIAIGVGQTVPRTFFKSLKPLGRDYSLEQGSLIAYRLVREAMKSTDGVGEPIDIWTIKNDEVTPKSESELAELKRLCKQWENSELLMAKDALLSLD